MSGVQYLKDKRGRKTAVVIDLKRHRRIWEDFHDVLLCENRKSEPRESLESVRRLVARREKLSA